MAFKDSMRYSQFLCMISAGASVKRGTKEFCGYRHRNIEIRSAVRAGMLDIRVIAYLDGVHLPPEISRIPAMHILHIPLRLTVVHFLAVDGDDLLRHPQIVGNLGTVLRGVLRELLRHIVDEAGIPVRQEFTSQCVTRYRELKFERLLERFFQCIAEHLIQVDGIRLTIAAIRAGELHLVRGTVGMDS